jgi:ankyrin repeat protein
MVTKLVDLFPLAMERPNDAGILPLHRAVSVGNDAATRFLLDRHSGAAQHRNNRREYPAHLIHKSISAETVKLLHAAYPAAFHLDTLLHRFVCASVGPNDINLVAQYVSQDHLHYTSTTNDQGQAPLHLMNVKTPLETIGAVLNLDKASVLQVDDKGDTPLHAYLRFEKKDPKHTRLGSSALSVRWFLKFCRSKTTLGAHHSISISEIAIHSASAGGKQIGGCLRIALVSS